MHLEVLLTPVLQLLEVVLVAMITVVIHESSHALAAMAVKIYVRRVVYGQPEIFRWSINGTRFSLGPIPVKPLVDVADETAPLYKRIVIMSAGIISNITLGVIAGSYLLMNHYHVALYHLGDSPHGFVALLAAFNLVIVAMNLLPIPGSDGRHILLAIEEFRSSQKAERN